GDEVFGSLNDYYLNMSGGRLRVHAIVINRKESLHGKPVWITLGQRKQDYQATDNAVFSDAVNAAYREGLDPSVSDSTKLAIIYAGNTYFLGGGLNPKNGWEGTAYTMSEVQGRPYNQELPNAKFSRIGIHCHEFGHTLGIGHSTGGRADLMYGGTSNGSVEGNAPAPFNAIVRSRMGWANVIPVENVNSEGVDVSYSLTNPTVYLMKNSQEDQFYIENRRFDQTMNIGGTRVPDYNNVKFFPPAGPHHSITQGIFVWRVNTFGDVLDPGYSTEGLVYASGRYGRTFPENERSDTDDGVPFPGVSNKRLLSPWSDPRNPYIKEVDYFGSGSTHYTLFVPNTKGGSNCGMEVLSENCAGGTFRVKFYTSNPPNPALARLPVPDSVGSYDSRRTIVRQDPETFHQVMDLGGEIFYRRSTDNGMSWSVPSRISQGSGGNSAPCITLAGPALLLAWQMDAYDAADTGRVMLLSRSTDAGKSWSDYMSVGWSYRCSAPGAYPSLAGAKDGSVMLVYRADRSSLVSEISRDAGITWSGASPVPVGDISWSTPSLLFGDASPGGVGDIAYCTDSLSGRVKVMVNGFTFGTGAWGSPGAVSGIVPQEYAGFKNPNIVTATQDAPSALNVAWDATDTYSGVPVIISRRVDIPLLGSSYSVFKGASQNDLSAAQFPLSFSGKPAKSYARVLTMMDSASGASVSIEIGMIKLVHRGGNVDTIRLSDSPSDSLMLDAAGLIQAGRSSSFALGTDADTLQIVAAIYGRNPGTLFANGHVGFEIVRTGSEAVIGQFGVESAASVLNGNRRLTLLSIPVSGLPRTGDAQAIVLRPFVVGLKQDSRLTASLAHIYSYVSENPVDRILAGVGGNASRSTVPQAFALGQNYPNPFNPSTTIRYAIPRQLRVVLTVYNILGQVVATLVDREEAAGEHAVLFNPVNLASGVYFCRLSAGGFAETKRMSLIR
ncbi:MAG TPA: T9SS type A sorting domain-containing protein, partial [Bacteroidota bacterium]